MLKNKTIFLSVMILSLIILIFPINKLAGEILPKPQPVEIPDFSKSEDLREWCAEKYGYKSRDDLDILPPKEPLVGDTNLKEESSESRSSRATYHKWWGAGIYQVRYAPLYLPQIKGGLAKHYIHDSLTLGTDEERTLYAPTLKAPNPNPLEVTTAYWYNPYLGLQRFVGIWDWATERMDFEIRIYFDDLDDDGWTATDGVGEYYETAMAWYPALDEWVVFLHNFDNSSWPIVYSQENDDTIVDHNNGWDIYEVYYDTSWPETPYLRADEIQVFYVVSQTWAYNSWPSGYVRSYWPGGFSLEHGFYNNYYDWYVGE
jgi:hypothetical protein